MIENLILSDFQHYNLMVIIIESLLFRIFIMRIFVLVLEIQTLRTPRDLFFVIINKSLLLKKKCMAALN